MHAQALLGRTATAPPCRGLRASRPRAGARSVAAPAHAASGKLTMYTNPNSRSQIIEWYAKEIGMTYDVVNLDMSRGEHKQPAYLAVHPFGKVPAITCADGTAVMESGAILLYLADKAGKLETPEKRAAAAQWVLWANATFAPAVFNSATRTAQLPALCGPLDAVLAKSPFVLGSEFSVADVAVGAYLAYVLMFFPTTSYKQWPNVDKYLKAIEKRPAFAATIGSE